MSVLRDITSASEQAIGIRVLTSGKCKPRIILAHRMDFSTVLGSSFIPSRLSLLSRKKRGGDIQDGPVSEIIAIL